MYQYKRETGSIITENRNILYLLDGEIGHVDFPAEIIWKFHKDNPGKVFALSHVHPPMMPNLSGEDQTTLQGWAYALDPYPIRMITITQEEPQEEKGFYALETGYLGILEPKSLWLQRNKTSPRKFEIVKEYQYSSFFPGIEDWYGKLLLDRSYERQ